MSELYPWLAPQWRSLAAAFEKGRFPHALLLDGQPGIGKLDFARYLANFLLCEQPQEGSTPCGK